MRRIWTIAALLVLVCFLLSWGGYRLLDRVPTFWVSRITIAGTQRCDQKRIKELTAPAYGRCIFKINLSDLHQKIRSIGWVKSLSIRRVMPSTLEIQIQERVPVGIVRADQLYLVDSEGVLIDVIQKKRSEEVWGHLPLIAGLNLQRNARVEKQNSAVGAAPCGRPHGATTGGCPYRSQKSGESACGEKDAFLLDSDSCILTPASAVDASCLKSALQAVALMQDMRALWLTEISEINVKDPDNIILCSKAARGTAREIRLGTTDNLREKLMYLQTTWSSIRALRSSKKEWHLELNNDLGSKPCLAPTEKVEAASSELDNTSSRLNKSVSGSVPPPDGGTSMGMESAVPSAPAIEYIDLRYKDQLIVKPLLKKVIGSQLSVVSNPLKTDN